jgi:hypothetical protein
VSFRIDGSLYPDEPPPVLLDSLAERVDYLARLCSAWDFGILPDGETLREICRRSPSWGASLPPFKEDHRSLLPAPAGSRIAMQSYKSLSG